MAGAQPELTATPKRKLGFAMCVALVVGNMIGSGVFLLPASLAPLGWNSVYGWLVTIAGSLCLVRVMARLARGRADGCAAYTYPAAAFGPATGFLVAWSYWISCWVTNAALAIAAVSNLSIIWPHLASPGIPVVTAIGFLWLFTSINCLGVRAAGEVQVVTTLLKVIPLAGAILLGIWAFTSGAATPPAHDAVPISLTGIGTAATFTLFAMLGFESAMAAGDRVANPERTIPRATMVGTAITGLIYLLACSAVTLLLPASEVAGSNAPFALFFGQLVHPSLGLIVAGFAAIAALGALNGFVLLQAEMPLALARENLFPRWFAAMNRSDVPWRIQILSTGLATLLVLVNYSRGLAGLFQFALLVTTSVSIILYFACVLASLRLARDGEIAVSAGFLAVAAAAAAYSAWAFYGAGLEASLWSLTMTAAGLPIYLVMRSATRPAANPPASPE